METVTPNPAASLVLLKGDPDDPLVLLGRRKESLRFMPGFYVFPGGRIDVSDYKEVASLNTDDIKPIFSVSSKLSKAEADAHIFGAIRELWEETGLLLGQPTKKPLSGTSKIIKAYNDNKLSPSMNSCYCLAQAITPSESPVRFNTYFFVADGGDVHEDSTPSGELEDIGWHKAKNVLDYLDIADVTEAVLNESKIYWKNSKYGINLDQRVPLMTYPTDKMIIQR